MEKSNQIYIINGSTKVGKGTSMHIVQWLKNELPESIEVNTRKMLELDQNKEYTLVFVIPIYVDGIPSHLLAYMQQLYETRKNNQNVHVFFIAIGGFPQYNSNIDVYSIMNVFCEECEWIFHGGLTLGMSQFIRNSATTLWLNKQVFESMKCLVEYIHNVDMCNVEHKIVNPKIANLVFVVFGNLYWMIQNVSHNGIPKNVFRKRYKKEKIL